METKERMSVKEMVTADYRTASVFERHSIDFCCGGKQTLDEACAAAGVDPATVWQALDELASEPAPETERYTEWPLDALIDHIVGMHHAYVRRMAPVILAHTAKIASVHGANHPELAGIAADIVAVVEELTRHMQKEELVLFPYIRVLAEVEQHGGTAATPSFKSIRNPIIMLEQEHEFAGDAFKRVRSASRGYTVPADGCTTYRVTYAELEEFERDLHQHVHLENNILFPKAIALEERLLGGC